MPTKWGIQKIKPLMQAITNTMTVSRWKRTMSTYNIPGK